MANQSKTEYDMQYAKERLKRIPLNVQKEKYEEIAAAAKAAGESVNGYIKTAIDEKMERTSSGESTPVAPDSDFVPQFVPQSEPQANKLDSDAAPVTSQAKPELSPNKTQSTGDLQILTSEAAAAVDLNRLLQDIMYQITIQETFGEEALAKLLDKAKHPIQ